MKFKLVSFIILFININSLRAQVKLDRAELISIVNSIYCIDYPAGTCVNQCRGTGIQANTCRYLDCGNRKIQTFDPLVFDGLTNVVTIDLSNNIIKTLPEKLFQGLSRLAYIYLAKNQISTLPANLFQGLYRLVILNLSNNFITNIDANVFRGLFSLEQLFLESNEMVSFDRNALIENVAIKKVCLYDNPISLFFPTSLQDICGQHLNCQYYTAKC